MNIDEKIIFIGNSKIIVRSPLVNMTEPEREFWFNEQVKNGNPNILEVIDNLNRWINK